MYGTEPQVELLWSICSTQSGLLVSSIQVGPGNTADVRCTASRPHAAPLGIRRQQLGEFLFQQRQQCVTPDVLADLFFLAPPTPNPFVKAQLWSWRRGRVSLLIASHVSLILPAFFRSSVVRRIPFSNLYYNRKTFSVFTTSPQYLKLYPTRFALDPDQSEPLIFTFSGLNLPGRYEAGGRRN